MAPFCLSGRFHSNKRVKLQVKKKKSSGTGNMQSRFDRLKEEMEEISEQQKDVREGQVKIREKLEAMECECEELKRETRLIIQRSGRTQIKLAIMFRILKAREQSDLATAAHLTQLLREIVERENEEGQDPGDS